ncbi:MAG: 3-isopropylmalate dehydrogenase (EC [uncultured Campylobacterales bacterium]|uniref:3-isopropylmalate dehydrogenase n=1 Tax=uncultured Campylobacterales bacterium TaxID=352960 RepID=A0A6S6SJ94_9BACT|nr:MAG: 3-isopropylmalate dehydrogenase (EC [uncultured Campylobacterales bacterium]
MKNYNIAVIKGDGIGVEIVDQALRVLNKISSKFNINFDFKEYLMGGCAIDATGNPLPDETLKGTKNSDAVLFGAIGGPKWDNVERHLRPESGLLKLRSELEVYANLRPVAIYDELLDASTLKPEVIKGVDLLVVRELTGGIYFGQPRAKEDNRAYNTMVYSRDEITRIAKIGFESAMIRDKKLCSVDKANVLEVSQLWREVVDAMSKDYPEVQVSHMYIDNAAMQLIRNPKQFDVILTSNIFGDILSDAASMVSGSIGMLASASLGGKVGIYEPIHGSAPDIAGRGISNPIATILSAAMMLEYSLNEIDAANAIKQAVKKTLELGYRTTDLASFGARQVCNTTEITDKILENL